MTLLDVISLSVGLMSLVLGGFAIWLSLHLYERAKDSEKVTATTLEGIRTQTDALQRLTGRWMDRLTRHVTQPRPADEGLIRLVDVVAQFPTAILSRLDTRPQADDVNRGVLEADLVRCYISLYHYSALANILAQAQLPRSGTIDESNEDEAAARNLVDSSAADFAHMAGVLNQIPPATIRASNFVSLLDAAVSNLQPGVRTSAIALKALAAQDSRD
jgi:hypothetical protein